jgi:hypothetical protein
MTLGNKIGKNVDISNIANINIVSKSENIFLKAELMIKNG